jgi:deazaflavin-dependent oxidoreductase (nitroreductase family)
MGLQEALDLRIRHANFVQGAMQAVAASKPGSWLFARTMHHIDKPLFRSTRGRVTLPGLMAGLPVIMLTTTGARSGKPRTLPLVGIPHGSDLAVIGSNYAQPSTPGWVYNLLANPQAMVELRSHQVPVTARLASDEEADAVFEDASAIYAGFAAYRDRLTTRSIRVFVLEPRESFSPAERSTPT